MKPMIEAFPKARAADLGRFLKAQDGDATKAAAMYAKHLEWRSSLPADLRNHALSEITKGKLYLHGRDRDGLLLAVWRTERNDPKVRSVEEMMTMTFYFSLLLEQTLDARGEQKFTMLIDRTNNILDLPYMKLAIPFLQDHFPERLHRVLVAPTSLFLRGIYMIVSPLLNKEVKKMVHLIDTCQHLQEFIDPAQLPVRMGGTDVRLTLSGLRS